jgi:hypothetical protein
MPVRDVGETSAAQAWPYGSGILDLSRTCMLRTRRASPGIPDRAQRVTAGGRYQGILEYNEDRETKYRG